MCVDCVLTSPRITQVDPSGEPLPEVVLSQRAGVLEVLYYGYLGSKSTSCVRLGPTH
jgi:hypothetical protein